MTPFFDLSNKNVLDNFFLSCARYWNAGTNHRRFFRSVIWKLLCGHTKFEPLVTSGHRPTLLIMSTSHGWNLLITLYPGGTQVGGRYFFYIWDYKNIVIQDFFGYYSCLAKYWILVFLFTDSYVKNYSKTFFINDDFGGDECFSSYFQISF